MAQTPKLHRENHAHIDQSCELCTKHYWGGSELKECTRCDVSHETADELCLHCMEEVCAAQEKYFIARRPHEDARLAGIQSILNALDIKMEAYFANTVQLEKRVESGEITQVQYDKFWELAQPFNDKFWEDISEIRKVYEEEMSRTR